jgi:hypothetical protein
MLSGNQGQDAAASLNEPNGTKDTAQNSRDTDGVADHLGGALFAFRASCQANIKSRFISKALREYQLSVAAKDIEAGKCYATDEFDWMRQAARGL